jgi:hypothetical protein
MIIKACRFIYRNWLEFLSAKTISRFTFRDNKFKPEIKDYSNYLIVAPHADDELIGCWTILGRTNVTVYYLGLLGENLSQSNANIRSHELLKFSNRKGFKVFTGDIDLVNREIRSAKYDAVFLPPVVDWHPEHVEVAKALYCHQANVDFFSYQISVPLPDVDDLYLVKMNVIGFIQKWYCFIYFYRSQLNLPIGRFMGYEFVSLQKGACERFLKLESRRFHCDYALKDKLDKRAELSKIVNAIWEN